MLKSSFECNTINHSSAKVSRNSVLFFLIYYANDKGKINLKWHIVLNSFQFKHHLTIYLLKL